MPRTRARQEDEKEEKENEGENDDEKQEGREGRCSARRSCTRCTDGSRLRQVKTGLLGKLYQVGSCYPRRDFARELLLNIPSLFHFPPPLPTSPPSVCLRVTLPDLREPKSTVASPYSANLWPRAACTPSKRRMCTRLRY